MRLSILQACVFVSVYRVHLSCQVYVYFGLKIGLHPPTNGENGETAFYIVLAQIELATLLFSQNVFLLKILPPHF